MVKIIHLDTTKLALSTAIFCGLTCGVEKLEIICFKMNWSDCDDNVMFNTLYYVIMRIADLRFNSVA